MGHHRLRTSAGRDPRDHPAGRVQALTATVPSPSILHLTSSVISPANSMLLLVPAAASLLSSSWLATRSSSSMPSCSAPWTLPCPWTGPAPFALDRDCGITPGREPGGDADRSAVGTWGAADALSVALDRALTLNPVSVLASIAVDVSGLDLSRAGIDGLDALEHVTFTAETTWPAGMAQSVRARSEEIRLGIYQLYDARERDAASPAIGRQPFPAAIIVKVIPSRQPAVPGDYRNPAVQQADGPAAPCPHEDPGATRKNGCELAAPPPP
jgi:hypothetical protein